MSHNEAATTSLAESPVSIYDRFTKLYDLMFRFNGYGRSIEHYLRETPLPLPAGARILDAGCGTGLLTLALLRVLRRPAEITAVDLSGRSLQTARRAVRKLAARPRHRVAFVRADALSLPFPEDSFDLVVTSGVLEYLPLREGLGEMARVLAPGGLLYFTVNFHDPVYSVAARLHAAWNAAGLRFEVGPFADHTVHLTLDAARRLFDGLPLRPLSERHDAGEAKALARQRPPRHAGDRLKRVFFKNALYEVVAEREP